MTFDVKITTQSVLDLLCPHYCRGCGRIGAVLCERCKNYNVLKRENFCPECGGNIERKCEDCRLPFEMTVVCGWRDEVLGELVKEYKYESVRAIAGVLAEVLAEQIPTILGEVVVVPLPTIRKHVRQRGIDHTWAVGQKLAERRGWRYERLLLRRNNTVQVGASAAERQRQAAMAYRINESLAIERTTNYLLLDDVWTTGASMLAAGDVMRAAGAEKVMMAVMVASRDSGEKLEDLQNLKNLKPSETTKIG